MIDDDVVHIQGVQLLSPAQPNVVKGWEKP